MKLAKAANGPLVRIMGRTFNPAGSVAEQKKAFAGSVKLIKGPNDMTQISVGGQNLSIRKLTSGSTASAAASKKIKADKRSVHQSVDIDNIDLNDRMPNMASKEPDTMVNDADVDDKCAGILSDDAVDGHAPQEEGRASMPRNQLFSSTTMSQMEHDD